MTTYIIASLVLLFLIIIFTRALPFIFGKRMEGNHLLEYLGTRLPISIIFLLIIYYVMSMSKPHHWHDLPWQILAIIATVLIHIKWRNTLLSIFGGTGVYLLLMMIKF